MKKNEMEIENILQSEITVYEDILLLEEEKGRAILKKDGKLIEDISMRQESLVREIDDLEQERINAAACYRRHPLSPGSGDPTLNEIAAVMEGESGARLLEAGSELKGILKRITEIQGVNAQMIRDNIDFFEILIEGLKDSSTIKSVTTAKAGRAVKR